MKCQKCDKLATFHISELTGSKPMEYHFCEEHAREYLNRSASQGGTSKSLAAMLAQDIPQKMSLNKAAEELQELDQQTCPICGISFHDFRKRGFLGCPHDYDFFDKQLDAFVQNIHGSNEHRGKKPVRQASHARERILLIKFRRDLEDAIQYEDYERASKLRDKILEIEKQQECAGNSPQNGYVKL